MQAPSTRRPPARARRYVRVIGAIAIAIVATTATTLAPQHGTAALLAKETFDRTPRPLGPISLIGDSVLLGALLYSPTLSDQLATQGWGPVRIRAGVGYTTGHFTQSGEARVSYWIDRWRREGWDPVDVVVGVGGNDAGYCGIDVSCAREAILYVVNAIGPGHRIWWPKITHHWAREHWQNNWNAALEQIAAERDDFFTWDWPGVMAAAGFVTTDNIHLSAPDYRTRSAMMATEITADLARATRTGGDVGLPEPAGPPSEFVPIEPTRIIDTRIDAPGHVPARTKLVIDVSDQVPPGTTAVAAYVSATNTGGPGYLTAYECSAGRPLASSANHLGGETRGAVAIVPISAKGRFCLYTHADADLLVDLQAAFVPLDSGGVRFTPLVTPARLADTRQTGRQEIVEVAVPDGAQAVAISVTAIADNAPGYLVAYPCTDPIPVVATVNYLAGEIISGAAFVPVSEAGTICVRSKAPADITIDLTGTFSSDGELAFVPVPPTRMIDTRYGTGGWSPIHGQLQVIDARVSPPNAEAVSGTITFVAPIRTGYLRAWGCGDQPDTANVTSLAGGVLANSVTTAVSDDGRLCVFARSTTSTLFDTTGWWVAA